MLFLQIPMSFRIHQQMCSPSLVPLKFRVDPLEKLVKISAAASHEVPDPVSVDTNQGHEGIHEGDHGPRQEISSVFGDDIVDNTVTEVAVVPDQKHTATPEDRD